MVKFLIFIFVFIFNNQHAQGCKLLLEQLDTLNLVRVEAEETDDENVPQAVFEDTKEGNFLLLFASSEYGGFFVYPTNSYVPGSNQNISLKPFYAEAVLNTKPDYGVSIPVLELDFRLKKNDNSRTYTVTGKFAFNYFLKFFDGRFKGIIGEWFEGDNFDTFVNAINNGKSPYDAAFETWTGKRAREAGYFKVEIIYVSRDQINYEIKDVKVLFTK